MSLWEKRYFAVSGKCGLRGANVECISTNPPAAGQVSGRMLSNFREFNPHKSPLAVILEMIVYETSPVCFHYVSGNRATPDREFGYILKKKERGSR